MNDLVRLAQVTSGASAPVKVKITKPADGTAQVIQVAPGMVLDLQGVAAQDVVMVHAGDRLIILFADRSSVVLAGFYGPDGQPIGGLDVDLGRGEPIPAAQLAGLLPISNDLSILPAAGPASPAGNAPGSSLHVSSVTPDTLGDGGRPLDLLAGGNTGDGGPSDGFSTVASQGRTNNVPVMGGETAGEATEDLILSVTGLITVADPDAGESQVVEQALAVGLYGTFSVTADGTWVYVLDNTNSSVQALGDGKSLTESFTVTSIDGSASQIVTVTINGTNDIPVIGGTAEATTVEDVTLSTSGTLTIADIDTGESSFIPQSNVAGLYGTFSVDAAGNWTYVLDNANSAVQSLGAERSMTDSFDVVSMDGSASQTVTVTIYGTNDVPVLGGETAGSVKEDTTLAATGVLTIADIDAGESNFTAQTGTAGAYGTFSVDADGTWTYLLDNDSTAVQQLGASGHLSESFTVWSSDQSASQTVTITIDGTNDVPVLGGTVEGAVTEEAALTATGVLTIADVDTGESNFIAQSNIAGLYGTFSVDAAGTWTYALDNANSAVQSLGAGSQLSENFTVWSSDQSASQTVTVAIHGTNDVPVLGGETVGSVKEDTTLTASGILTIADVDTGESNFTAQTGTAGQYGIFSVDAAGHWTYTLANGGTAVQSLTGHSHVFESFTVWSADQSASQIVTVLIDGTNDVPVIGGTSTSAVKEDTTFSTGGVLTIADADIGESSFIAQSNTAGTYGTFSIDAAGVWTYTLANSSTAVQSLGANAHPTETFTVWSSDQTTSQTVTVVINGTNDVPTLYGVTSGPEVTEDGVLSTGNNLYIIDRDTGEAFYEAQANTAGTYGTFSIDANGHWTYTLNNGSAAVQSLGLNNNPTETFTVWSADHSASLNVTVQIRGTNDVPTFGGDIAGAATEDNVLITAGVLTISDPDAGQSAFIARSNVAGTYGTFSVTSAGAWTYTLNNGATAVQNLGPDSHPTETFTVTSADGTASTTVTVTVNGTNDAPAGANKTITAIEDTAYTFTASDFGFTDAEGNALLGVKITQLPGAGSLTLNGVAVTADQTVSASDIASGLLKFTAAANASGTSYANFKFAVQDNGGTANGGTDTDQSPNTITLNVTGVNDAPAGADKTISAFEDTAYIFTAADFGFTDTDGNTLSGVKITQLPGAGTLTLNGVAVTADQIVTASAIASGLLRFTSAANASGSDYATIQFAVQDNGGTANGGVNLDQSPNTITVNVGATNDAPSGTNKTVTTLEDTAYTFAASDFGFTDTDGNALQGVKITQLPAAGSLTLNGVAVTLNQIVSASDIDSGLLKFNPAANANGSSYASFRFAVQDDGGTANGGVNLDQSPNTITLNVTSVPDAPILDASKSPAMSVNEDAGNPSGAVGVAVSTIVDRVIDGSGPDNFTDPDSFIAGMAVVGVNTSLGTLYYSVNGGTNWSVVGAVSPTSSFLLRPEYLLYFKPAANYSGTIADAVTFRAWDLSSGTPTQYVNTTVNGGSTPYSSATDTISVTVNNTNDAPVAQAKSASVSEDGTLTGQSVTATDPDADPLTYAIVGTAPEGLLFNTDGTWSYTPPANYQSLDNGEPTTVSFQYKANDGTADSNTATVTLTINGANDAPVAQDRAVSVSEDGLLTGQGSGATDVDIETLTYAIVGTTPEGLTYSPNGLWTYTPPASYQSLDDGESAQVTFQYKANDGTVDSDIGTVTITITGANDAPVTQTKLVSVTEDDLLTGQTVTATDIDGEDLTYAIVGTTPEGLTFNTDGTWSYAPPASFQSFDDGEFQNVTFQYKANDGTTNSNTSSVTITVTGANDAPVAQDISVSVSEDGILAGQSLAATDIDIEPRSFVIDGAAPPGLTLFAEGIWRYTPPASLQSLNVGESEQVTFKYRAYDGTAFSNAATVTITINGANDAPTIGSLGSNASIEENQTGALIRTFTVNDVDTANGLTFRVLDQGGAVDSRFEVVAASGTTPGQPGSYELRLVAGQSLDFEVEQADGNPAIGLTIEVNDQGAGNNIATAPFVIMVTDVNEAPTAVSFSNTTTEIDETADTASAIKVADIAITDDALGTNGLTLSGADADSFEIIGNALYLKAGVVLDYETKAAYNVTVEVDDAAVGATPDLSQSFTLTVTDVAENEAPVVVSPTLAVGSGTEDAVLTFGSSPLTANFTDANNDTLTVISVSATSASGASVTLDTLTGEVIYDPRNATTLQAMNVGGSTTDSFTYTVSDGHGGTATATATVTITGVNDAAVISGVTTTSILELGVRSSSPSVTGHLSAADVDNPSDTWQVVTAQTATNNHYGTYVINAAGFWTYTLDNANTAVNSMTADDVLTDTFTVYTVDGTAQLVTMYIGGNDDAPVARGDTGSMTENDGTKVFNVLANDTLDPDTGAPNTVSVGNIVVTGGSSYGIDASDLLVTVTNDNQLQVQLLGTDWNNIWNGGFFNVSINYSLNGDQSVSSVNVLSLTMNGLNDAPVLNAAASPTITAVEDAATPVNGMVGTAVSTLVDRVINGSGLDNVTDPDSFIAGIAIVGQNTSQGTWYYSIDNGSSWAAIGAVSSANALTLRPEYLLYFKPNANYSGTITDALTFRAWDGSGGNPGGYSNTTVNGGTSPYSTATDTISLTVTTVNDAAVITGVSTGTVTEAGAAGAGTPTATGDLNATDVDNPADAWTEVTTATATTNGYGTYTLTAAGVWAYTLDNTNPTVNGLAAGAPLTDTFTVQTIDGTSKVVTVTITGADDTITSINLDNVALGQGGFKIIGQNGNDNAGGSIASAGDINNDGYDDLLIGATGNDSGEGKTGAAYVVYGGANPALINGVINLDTIATGVGGFKIVGQTVNASTGYDVSAAGDFNNDGYGDLLIGAYRHNSDGTSSGTTYVVYGGSNAALSNGAIDLDLVATGVGGFRIIGENADEWSGFSVASAGDVNGDGYADVVIGAARNATGGSNSGATYVVYGGPDAVPGDGTINLDNVAQGIGGFKIIGQDANNSAGYSVSSAGDINQDGFADLFIGTANNTNAGGTGAGAAYVVYGGPNAALSNGVINLDTVATGTGGFKIIGQDAGDNVGTDVAAAGDVNGDGIGDLVIGSESTGRNMYVIYGGTNPALVNGIIDLDTVATGVGGFKLVQESGDGSLGTKVTAAGDVNGDGYADLLIGSRSNTDADHAGAAYLVYGGPNSAIVNGVLNLSVVAAGTGGFKISGENPGDAAGASVAAAGDINGDGFDDLIVGATLNDAGGSNAGAAYVIYGGQNLPNNTSAHIGGTDTGAVTEDATTTVSGVLTVTNPDLSAGTFTAATLAGTYGSFSLQADGAWTYTLDNANGTVQALNDGDSLSESFRVASADGTAIDAVTVTINGADDVAINAANVALGIGGFKIIGQAALDFLGSSVASAGDINGDGYGDLIIGAYQNSSGGTNSGSAYVVYGTAAALTSIDLNQITAGNGGFKIIGQGANDHTGVSVASAGDINGDGFDDLIVGASQNTNQAGLKGAAYVVYGQATPFSSIDLDNIAAGTGGFKITGQASGDRAGISVDSAGDLNGDGYDDLIVGAYFNDADGTDSGAAYVIYGKAEAIASVDLNNIVSGSGGFRIAGETAQDYAGHSVATAGDVNGDGYDDFIIGAYKNDAGGADAGAAYVVYGQAAAINSVNLDDIALGSGGFKITGQSDGDFTGYKVASAGDINGDGYDDLIIGAYKNDAGGEDAGAAYVVYGAATGITSVDLDNIALGNGGFRIIGEAAGDTAGTSVASAGDVNGDGHTDLIIGADGNDAGGPSSGSAYVVYGTGSDFTSIDLDDIALGHGGFRIAGEELADDFGRQVASAGDLNGDGYDDIVVGSANSAGGLGAGAAYVIYGGAELGGQSGLTLTGTAGADTLTGKAGGDLLLGDDGADILFGGLGGDTFKYTATSQGGDTIEDFTSDEDLVSIFNGLLGVIETGELEFDGTAVGSSTVLFESVGSATAAAQNDSAKLIFDTANHDLYYDGDGGFSSSGRILLAHLENGGLLDATNVMLTS